MVNMTKVDTSTELFKKALTMVADMLVTDLGTRYADEKKLMQSIEFDVLKIIVEEANKENNDTFEDVLLKCKAKRRTRRRAIIEHISKSSYLKRLICGLITNLEYKYKLLNQPNYLKKEDFKYIPAYNSSRD